MKPDRGREGVAQFTGRRVFVTGGSSGIGAAIVNAFAAEGAAVAIGASRRAGPAEENARRINASGGRAIVVKADLTDRAATDRAADQVLAELGGLDVFVHCAGIDVTETAPTHLTPEDLWDRMLAIHLTAVRSVAAAYPRAAAGHIAIGHVRRLGGGARRLGGDVAITSPRPAFTISPAASPRTTPRPVCGRTPSPQASSTRRSPAASRRACPAARPRR